MAHTTAEIPQKHGMTSLREPYRSIERIQLVTFCARLFLECPHWRESQLQASDISAKRYHDAQSFFQALGILVHETPL